MFTITHTTTNKMKKATLNATGNDGKFHKYAFEKNENFKNQFINLMGKLGFKDFIESSSSGNYKTSLNNFWSREVTLEEKENPHEEERVSVNPPISFFEDHFQRFKNEDYEVELFLGHKKGIITIRLKTKNKDKREKFINEMLKFDWITEEEIKKRIEKKNKFLRGCITKHSARMKDG